MRAAVGTSVVHDAMSVVHDAGGCVLLCPSACVLLSDLSLLCDLSPAIPPCHCLNRAVIQPEYSLNILCDAYNIAIYVQNNCACDLGVQHEDTYLLVWPIEGHRNACRGGRSLKEPVGA
jgi:hypothetical protein